MALSDFRIYNTQPEVKPVVRILSDGTPVIVSANCLIAKLVADRYCDYVRFINVKCGMVLV